MRSRAFALFSALALCAIAASVQLLLGGAVRADKGPSDAAFENGCLATRLACVADTVPNDPSWGLQYGPQVIQAPKAWDQTIGNPATVIAIVDTGIDCTHPELAGKCVPGFNVIAGAALTETQNSDHFGHGTHVACIAACNTNNSVGVARICWQ